MPREEGPYLVITKRPAGTTEEQLQAALAAAEAVFAEAGVDPLDTKWDYDVPENNEKYEAAWEAAEQAATDAAWAPRPGTPEPTVIDIFIE